MSRFWRRLRYLLQLSESCHRSLLIFQRCDAVTSRAQCSPALFETPPECIQQTRPVPPHCGLPRPKLRTRVQPGTSGPTLSHPSSQTPEVARSSAPSILGRKTFLSSTSPPTLPGLYELRLSGAYKVASNSSAETGSAIRSPEVSDISNPFVPTKLQYPSRSRIS